MLNRRFFYKKLLFINTYIHKGNDNIRIQTIQNQEKPTPRQHVEGGLFRMESCTQSTETVLYAIQQLCISNADAKTLRQKDKKALHALTISAGSTAKVGRCI